MPWRSIRNFTCSIPKSQRAPWRAWSAIPAGASRRAMRLSVRSSLLAGLLMLAATAFAHPMGNFSVNHYARISAGANGIRLRYLLDLAEIPTYQEMQRTILVADPVDGRSAK